jgi:HK97 family phage major capsid protein
VTKKEYLAKRKALLDAAEALLNEGKMEDYEAKCKEVEALDAQFEAIAKAQANMNALKDKAVVADDAKDLQTDSQAVDTTGTAKPKDEKEAYRDAWAKVMMGYRLEGNERMLFDKVNTEFKKEFKNLVQTTNDHAVVIPETVAADIWIEAEKRYPIIADTDMTFVPGDLTILQETDSGDDAAWYDEDTEVVDGDFVLGELNLTGCELAKAVPISWKLRKMSIEKFIPYIVKLLGRKMGAALAKGLVSGKGKPGAQDVFKPEPKGVKTAILAEDGTPQVVTYDAEDGISYAEMTQAMGKVGSVYKTGAAIYATSTTIWGQLALIQDGIGRPLFIPDVTGGGVARMFGLPVKEDDSITEGEVLIGNMADGYAANVNENMTIYTEDHIKKRYTDYMSYAIIDGAPETTKAFALIQPEAVL